MRLALLKRGQSRRQRLLFGAVRLIAGRVPGPLLVLSYNKPFFGKDFARLLQLSMRELKHWSVAEAELFAALVSKENQCEY